MNFIAMTCCYISLVVKYCSHLEVILCSHNVYNIVVGSVIGRDF